jgi:hypothetical protein
MEPFQEAQKHAGKLMMRRGSRSIFVLMGQLLADIQGRDLDDTVKWKVWKIAKMAGENRERLEGCKVSEVKNLFQMIFGDVDRMHVDRFDEVLRYTEYCRRIALFESNSNDIHESLAVTIQTSNIKNHSQDGGMVKYDVTKPHNWTLTYFQLSNGEISKEDKRQLAHDTQRSLMQHGLWDQKDMNKELKTLCKVIIDILIT